MILHSFWKMARGLLPSHLLHNKDCTSYYRRSWRKQNISRPLSQLARLQELQGESLKKWIDSSPSTNERTDPTLTIYCPTSAAHCMAKVLDRSRCWHTCLYLIVDEIIHLMKRVTISFFNSSHRLLYPLHNVH